MSNEPLLKLELPGVKKIKSGKVREVFDLGDRLLFVATDRISAFDCVMPNGIPRKGEVLTQISYFWFEQTERLVAESSGLQGRRPACPPNCKSIPPCWRGAAWWSRRPSRWPLNASCAAISPARAGRITRRPAAFAASNCRRACAIPRACPSRCFTPATKAETGHDENISFEEACEITGREIAEKARDLSLKIYSFAAEYALKRGLIIADTKFEFGLRRRQVGSD